MDRATTRNSRSAQSREGLKTLLDDWGRQVSSLFDQLEAAESELGTLRSAQDSHDQKLQALSDRADGQSELIDVLRAEADEAHALNDTVRSQEQEIVRLKSEIDSKQELVRALRRDADGIDRLQAEVREKDSALQSLTAELEASQTRAAALESELSEISESSADAAAGDQAEVAALKAELEARKTLIRSLRSDSDRVRQLEEELESKRQIVVELENAINSHVETIAGLRRNADMWRRKYQTLKGSSGNETSTELPAITTTDVAALQQLEQEAGGAPDKTVAIDVRGPLREARKRVADSRGR